MNRYSRHILLSEIGAKGQQRLTDAKVLVIGAGGLGCPVLQYLAAAGIGTLGIMDFDTVDISNLQRQILFGSSVLGRNKALAASERLKDLNSDIQINTYPFALTTDNALQLFNSYDVIVDGTDNFGTRYLINDAAILSHKPVVYGAIYKFEGQVSVFNYDEGPSYRCLFPTPPKAGMYANCSDVGVLGVLPGIIGTMQANEVLKILLQIGTPLRGQLFCFDAKTNNSYTLKIQRQEDEIAQVIRQKEAFLTHDYSWDCQTEAQREIDFEGLQQLHQPCLVDIREPHEVPHPKHINYLKIPLSELEERIQELPKQGPIVLFCQSGQRSLKALQLLEHHQLTTIYSLLGGVHTLIKTPYYERT